MLMKASPLRAEPVENVDVSEGVSTPRVIASSTPTSSPRMSTFGRQAAEVLAGASYSSPNPFEADTIEFGHGRLPIRGRRVSPFQDHRRTPAVSVRMPPLKQKGETPGEEENDQDMGR